MNNNISIPMKRLFTTKNTPYTIVITSIVIGLIVAGYYLYYGITPTNPFPYYTP